MSVQKLWNIQKDLDLYVINFMGWEVTEMWAELL
jgi:hypothetical protein